MPVSTYQLSGCAPGLFVYPSNPPIGLERIADAASRLIDARGGDYAKDAAPRSPNPELSGNKPPMKNELSWLAGKWKCSQFVGDALYEAGFRMPTYRMPDGSAHYMNAERLPTQTKFFDTIKNRDEVRPGDLLVIDYHGADGENGAHVEVVGAVGCAPGDLITLGAHKDGAAMTERSGILGSASASGTFWNQESARVYILRPKRLLQ